jgi:hypothetical protein
MNKQRFKREVLTDRRVVNNLHRYYDLCTSEEIDKAKDWYNETHTFCVGLSLEYNVSLYKVVGVFSALSPQLEFNLNKIWCKDFFKSNGKGMYGNRAKTIKCNNIYKKSNSPEEANSLLSVKDDSALKTKNFFWNILEPEDSTGVCVDTHAIAACVMRPEETNALPKNKQAISSVQYRFFEQCYKSFAYDIDMKPLDAQALIWEKRKQCRESSKVRNVLAVDVPDEIYNAFDF